MVTTCITSSSWLALLRPHLHQAYLDAERRRHPTPRLTARQRELLRTFRPGLAVTAELIVERRRILNLLLDRLRNH